MSRVVTSRVSDELEIEVDAYAEDQGISRSRAAAALMAMGAREWRRNQLGPWSAITTVVIPTGSGGQP